MLGFTEHFDSWLVMEEFSFIKKKDPKKSAFQDSKDYKLTTEIMERQFLSVDT